MNMSLSLARAVADAVLYEGYLLYPYRASSQKNQARWQFGILGPAGRRGRRCRGRTGHVRRLPARPRTAGRGGRSTCASCSCRPRTAEQADDAGGFTPVDELAVGAARWLSWDEAVEHEITLGPFPLADADGDGGLVLPVDVPAARTSRNCATAPARRPGGWCAAVARCTAK